MPTFSREAFSRGRDVGVWGVQGIPIAWAFIKHQAVLREGCLLPAQGGGVTPQRGARGDQRPGDYFPCAVWGTSASRAMFNSPRAPGHSGQGGGGIQPGWSWALCCGCDAKGACAPAAVTEPTPCIKTRRRRSGRDWVPLPTLQTLQLTRHPPMEPPGASWALSACLPFPPLLSASSFIISPLLPPSLCLSSLPLPFVPSLLFPSLLAGASPHLQSLLQLPSLCQLSIDPLFSIGGQLS